MDSPHLDSTLIFDRAAALQGLQGSEQALRDVTQIFFDQSGKLMTDMRDAVASEDYKKLELSAHTLRGSAEVLAAPEVSRLARQIEQNARQRDLSRAIALFHDVEKSLPSLIAMIRKSVALSHRESLVPAPPDSG